MHRSIPHSNERQWWVVRDNIYNFTIAWLATSTDKCQGIPQNILQYWSVAWWSTVVIWHELVYSIRVASCLQTVLSCMQCVCWQNLCQMAQCMNAKCRWRIGMLMRRWNWHGEDIHMHYASEHLHCLIGQILKNFDHFKSMWYSI